MGFCIKQWQILLLYAKVLPLFLPTSKILFSYTKKRMHQFSVCGWPLDLKEMDKYQTSCINIIELKNKYYIYVKENLSKRYLMAIKTNLQHLACQILNASWLFYSLELVRNRTKVKVLDTTLERETNTAREYSSTLWTSLQRNSLFQWDHQTVVLLPRSFCICEIVLDIWKT